MPGEETTSVGFFPRSWYPSFNLIFQSVTSALSPRNSRFTAGFRVSCSHFSWGEHASGLLCRYRKSRQGFHACIWSLTERCWRVPRVKDRSDLSDSAVAARGRLPGSVASLTRCRAGGSRGWACWWSCSTAWRWACSTPARTSPATRRAAGSSRYGPAAAFSWTAAPDWWGEGRTELAPAAVEEDSCPGMAGSCLHYLSHHKKSWFWCLDVNARCHRAKPLPGCPSPNIAKPCLESVNHRVCSENRAQCILTPSSQHHGCCWPVWAGGRHRAALSTASAQGF